MPKFIRQQSARDEEGFTLIELMVVVMIIAILIAIAVPTFLGARERAQNRAVQSNLRTAISSAKSIYTEKQSYPASAAMATQLAAEEPSLTFQNNHYTGTTTGASTAPKQIGVWVLGNESVIIFGRSASGKCYAAVDNNGPAAPPSQPQGTSFGEIIINGAFGCGAGSPFSNGNVPTGF